MSQSQLAQIHIMITSTLAPSATPSLFTSPFIALPEKYAGDPTGCQGFMLQWSLSFSNQGVSKWNTISQFINLLMDKVLAWVTTVWYQGGEHTSSYDWFLQLFQQVSDHSPESQKIAERLLILKQGNLSAAEFALNFHTLAVDSGWNEPALKAACCQGLNTNILTALSCQDDPASLDSLIELSIHLDLLPNNRMKVNLEVHQVKESPVTEPMQLGQTRLTPVECQKHRKRDCATTAAAQHTKWNKSPSDRQPKLHNRPTSERPPLLAHPQWVLPNFSFHRTFLYMYR